MKKAEVGPDPRRVSGHRLFAWLFVMFIGHGLDATAQHEWRLLYGLRDLPGR